jgi:hypothetical protein
MKTKEARELLKHSGFEFKKQNRHEIWIKDEKIILLSHGSTQNSRWVQGLAGKMRREIERENGTGQRSKDTRVPN